MPRLTRGKAARFLAWGVLVIVVALKLEPYEGSLAGSSSNAFKLLVLEDGSYWTIYGRYLSGSFIVDGFIQGTGTSDNGTFASGNARDFGFAPALPASINATYDSTAETIAGTASYSAANVTFNGGPAAGALYDYSAAASLSTIAGTWSLTESGGETVALSVAANGQFTTVASSGCNMGGSVAPRASGKNVYNVSLIFGGAPCALPGQAATGIAVAYPVGGGRTEMLLTVVEGNRQYGSAAVGSR